MPNRFLGWLLGKAPLGNLQAGAVVGAGVVDAVNYLIRDDFTSDLAAGSVNGTNAEPGPGQRDTYDTGNKLAIAGTVLIIADSVGSQDPTQVYNAIQRRAGRILLTTITTISTGNHGRIGWSTDAADGTILDSGLRFVNTASIATQIAGAAGPEVGSFAAFTFYEVAIILRAAGFAGLVRGGIYAHWELMWLSESVLTTPMFPGAQVIGAGRGFSSHYMHVPAQLWLPVPLISDGFSLSAESDGLGHAEGVAGSVAGQGGDGVAWTGAAWAVSGGKASNTPVTGGNIATDGGLENWGSATDLTSWTEAVAGTSTVNREASVIHGGTFAARFDVDASNSLAKISQTITNSNGDWLLVKVWAKASVAGKIIQADENAGSNQGPALTLTTSYQQFVTLIRATKANTDVGIKRSAGGSSSLYIDDITIEVVTITSLLRVADAGDDDIIATVSITRTTGSLAGLVLALDSAATPANGVFVFLDGTNYLRVAKVVSGVYTPLATTAITYSAGAELRVSKRGSSFRIYYNNAVVGSTLTISDAGIVSNTLCGLLSTSGSNEFDNFAVYARGTDGSYDSVLGALSPMASLTGATWAVDGNGRAYNTPTLGAELLTNGGFETGTPPSNWTAINSPSTWERSSTQVQSGSYSGHIIASADATGVQSGVIVPISGLFYQLTGYIYPVSGIVQIIATNSLNASKNTSGTGAWQQLIITPSASTAGGSVARAFSSGGGAEFYVDEMSLKAISTSSLIATTVGVATATVAGKIYNIITETASGVIGWCDNPADPQNFVLAAHFGNSIRLVKWVAGVRTQLLISSSTFVQDATIEIRRPSGNTFQLWYNGSQVGADQPINDSAIADNTAPFFGPFSTYSGNTFTLFTLSGVVYRFPGA